MADPAHAYCLDTVLGRCSCFEVHLHESAIQHLSDLFRTLDNAVEVFGMQRLLGTGNFPRDWQLLDFGCTLRELEVFIENAVCVVVSLVGGLLSGLLNGRLGH